MSAEDQLRQGKARRHEGGSHALGLSRGSSISAVAIPSYGQVRSNRQSSGFLRCTVARVSEPWLSADDIATHLGVTKDSVYAWIANKGMPAHKVGRLWRFQASEVDAWVRRGGADAGSRAEDVSKATRAGAPDK